MATALDTYMPYDSGPGANVTEDGWRKFAKYFRGDGVIRSATNQCNVFGDSSGMQVKIDTGEVWIQGAWGQNASLKTLPVSNNSSGNPRIDLAIARNDFVNNRIEFDVLLGTPAVSPSAPALTQNTSKWEVQLAPISVASGAVTITAGNVTFLPQFTDGSAEYLKGINSVDQPPSGTGSGQTVTANTTTAVKWNTVVTPSSAVSLGSNLSTFTFLRPGMWIFTYGLEWNNLANGTRWVWFGPTATSGAKRRGQSVIDDTVAGFHSNTGSGMVRVAAGDQYTLFCFSTHTTGTAVVLGGTTAQDFDASNIQLYWLGE